MTASRDLLIEAINRLPEQQKQALHLRYVEECTDTEIAAILGLTELEAACIVCSGWCAVRQALGRDTSC
jgi:DNA-directed RNA polymerase specialized sigma subunit